ncbi:MAG TPA: exodeoxyribonuclease VII large subunit [Acidimicrobiales bacterium]|nr:exodeoxyribonuclease VII large subunit [Acidimicrobiales bacterium]
MADTDSLSLFPPDAAAVRRISMLKLSAEVARSLAGIGRIVVEGEVVKPWRGPNGVIVFTLKDRTAQLAIRCPAGKKARCRVVAGERVAVTGLVQWLPERGQLQLVAEEVTPVGEGAIAAAIAEVRARLVADGLLDRPRRPLPRLPRLIGVVCGTEAAVQADIESVVAARFAGYPIEFLPTLVTGAGAADAIVRSLQFLDGRPEVDVIILARGGGDAAQLLPWSDEALCRAVAGCTTPVVSAIGHEGDRPLCDEVADLRCGTPSLAAGAVVPDRALLDAQIDALLAEARRALADRLERSTVRLAAVDRAGALRAGVVRAGDRLEHLRHRIDMLHPGRAVDAAAQRLAAEWRQVEALSPVRVLERGYAVVRSTLTGEVVRRPDQVGGGDEIDVQVAAGRFGARVEER